LKTGERARAVMERLISLFREPDYEKWSPSAPQAEQTPRVGLDREEPLYFQQLLDYLREQRGELGELPEESASAEADMIGARA